MLSLCWYLLISRDVDMNSGVTTAVSCWRLERSTTQKTHSPIQPAATSVHRYLIPVSPRPSGKDDKQPRASGYACQPACWGQFFCRFWAAFHHPPSGPEHMLPTHVNLPRYLCTSFYPPFPATVNTPTLSDLPLAVAVVLSGGRSLPSSLLSGALGAGGCGPSGRVVDIPVTYRRKCQI